MPKHAIINDTLFEPMYIADAVHSQTHFSVIADGSVCISLWVYIPPHCGNTRHLLCHGTSAWMWISDTSSHKRHFFSSYSHTSMLCLTILPFVELDGDKWIRTLGFSNV